MPHRILLLNFSKAEAEALAKAGYNVERGYLGRFVPASQFIPYNFPHPPYEYDVMFYNSEAPRDVANEFRSQGNLLSQPGLYRAFSTLGGAPHVRVSLVGRSVSDGALLHGGVPFVETITAEENVSSFVERPVEDEPFSIKEVHSLIANFKGQIRDVAKFFRTDKAAIRPLHQVPVLTSKSGEVLAAYGTQYASEIFLRYIVLPQVKNNAQVCLSILQSLEVVRPELFPDRLRQNWIKDEEFLLPDERAIHKVIADRTAEVAAFIQSKKKELEERSAANSFVRNLLVATEVDEACRLSTVVKRALEFIGFKVEDIDEKIKNAIKKEDFWVIDRDFLAITEVTATKGKNPKVKEYNDILGRITTIYKRKGELVPPAGTISGLLVLNYDVDTHPASRPRAYTGEHAGIAEAAAEQAIGLLSAVDLHRIVVAVIEGSLTKEAARELLKKPGRIEFNAARQRASAART